LPRKKTSAESPDAPMIKMLPPPPRGSVRQSSAELAATYLRGLIFDGTLPPGSRIPQDQVAEALGLSRIPIREALAMLAAEGRVTIELNRGAFVNSMDEKSVHEAMDLMHLVIDYVVRRAVDHTNTEFVTDLQRLRRQLKVARRPDEVDQIVDEMRRAIFRNGTSPRVFAALRHVLTLTPYNFCEAFPLALPIQKRIYEELVRAIAASDADLAAEVWAKGGIELNAIVLEDLKKRGVVADT
jgi:DNA-binding GntR family transcriptional regulator